MKRPLQHVITFALGIALLGGCPPVEGPADATDVGVDTSEVDCVGNGCGTSPCGTVCPIGVCHPELGICVACLEHDDCGGAQCHPTSNACVQCYDDAHCPGGKCTEALVCVECTVDLDCGQKGTCDLTTQTCVGECTADQNCDDTNVCTLDVCDEGTCRYTDAPDKTLCEDGDKCTMEDGCIGGFCKSGVPDPACCEPIKCSTFLNAKDTDEDGCEDTCYCPDGTLPDNKGQCVCTTEPSCPKGSVGVDLDKDGCVESCDCEDDSCLSCESDKQCVDEDDACTKGTCVAGACSIKVATGCCNEACDCYDENEPKLQCVNNSGYFECTNNSCVETCGPLPAEVKACVCKAFECTPGLTPGDTDGDGCDDACLCPGGGLAGPDGCAKCETACDCYEANLLFPKGCQEGENHWSCAANHCVPTCGELSLEAKICLPCSQKLSCSPGTLGVDTDKDGCADTCVCPDGELVNADSCDCLTTDVCIGQSLAVDGDLDGCVNWCQCPNGISVKPGDSCPCLEEIKCPDGQEPVDSFGDGCPDVCVCVGDACVECKEAADCNDNDPCTEDKCVDGQCSTKNTCCTPIDCPKGAQFVDTSGDGCFDTCDCPGGLKPGADACTCLINVFCKEGLSPTDTNGDGCADSCLSKCTETCDCYKDNKGQDKTCVIAANTGQGGYWLCENEVCIDYCGPLPASHYKCLGCVDPLVDCVEGLTPTDATDDGCPDTCAMVCEDDCDCFAIKDPDAAVCDDVNCPGCQPTWNCNQGLCESGCNPKNQLNDCAEEIVNCKSSDDCPKDASFCFKSVGACDDSGICAAKPTDCDAEGGEVCGCDAKIYSNECAAFKAGTSLATAGKCP